jgi:hypothetical protein
MFFAIEPSTFNSNYATLTEKTKNNVIENSWFHRIMYEHDKFTMNGVAIHFSLLINKTETSYDKLKHCFSYDDVNNQAVVDELVRIEREILSCTTLFEGKQALFHINNQTSHGFIKLFNGTSHSHKTHSTVAPIIPQITHHTLKTYHMKQKPLLNFAQSHDFVLKISGVWCNDVNYGVTYKFEKAPRQVVS